MNEIEKREVTEEQIVKYLQAFGFDNGLSKQEQAQFIEIAQAYQLNPFKREIYCIPYKTKNGRKLSIITGYEVYLKRAERIGTLDGWNVKTEGHLSKGDLKAIVTIYRKDWKEPFVHEVWFKEYNQGNAMWNSKPITMIKKVAIAQAFRMAFPDEFGGMPYVEGESDNIAGDNEDIVAKPAKIDTTAKRKEIEDKLKSAEKEGYITADELQARLTRLGHIELDDALDVYAKAMDRYVEKKKKAALPEKPAKEIKSSPSSEETNDLF